MARVGRCRKRGIPVHSTHPPSTSGDRYATPLHATPLWRDNRSAHLFDDTRQPEEFPQKLHGTEEIDGRRLSDPAVPARRRRRRRKQGSNPVPRRHRAEAVLGRVYKAETRTMGGRESNHSGDGERGWDNRYFFCVLGCWVVVFFLPVQEQEKSPKTAGLAPSTHRHTVHSSRIYCHGHENGIHVMRGCR